VVFIKAVNSKKGMQMVEKCLKYTEEATKITISTMEIEPKNGMRDECKETIRRRLEVVRQPEM